MALPTPPQKPDLEPKPRGSWLGIMMAGGASIMMIVALTFLTIGYFGPVLVVAAIFGGVIVFHYCVWGWWLPQVLRQAAEEDLDD